MREELIVCEEKENTKNRRIYYTIESVGISNKVRGEAANKIIIDEVQEKPAFMYDSRRIKVINDEEVSPDVVVDETPELAQADLKKEDPKEDEIEKTLASYGIVLDYVYDFSADENKRESVTMNGCQRWNKDGTK